MKKKSMSQFICYALLTSCYAIQADATCCQQDRQDRSEKPFLIDIDYLFWKAEENQTYYATKSPGGFQKDNFLTGTSYNIIKPCFKGTSGLRAKAGYFFCDDCENLDTRASYTHLNSCNTSNVKEENGIVALALINNTNKNIIASEAQNRWSAKFNSVDWEIGITTDLCDTVFFRPHIGIKWAEIDQQQNIAYLGIAEFSEALVKKYNKFSGVGPRMGIDSQWYFCEDLSIIGNISGALLYGTFNARLEYAVTTAVVRAAPASETFSPTVFDCKKSLAPTTQIFLGLNWETSRKCTLIDMSIGYEVQYWWNQWQSMPSLIGVMATTPGHGDFMLHGLTASLGIRF